MTRDLLIEAHERIDELEEHIATTIETLIRGDEFPMLPDDDPYDPGGNPLRATIDRLTRALDRKRA